ncbi:hypothetical protein [Kitasatospora kifunensis]|uniref:Uncharacterized membrane protein YhaH (DUF805 family) n=1 Tax=Kitasatospora kifunensis TaxID=58351 RepID=A0A7W7R9E0_KITKI|nr:hypothetical protein [Kitasatospora kifunensis]MBB4927518.1 uncharacterized membrane protein YhaH (DUF805 family) [Kitasatospora kifunensis]
MRPSAVSEEAPPGPSRGGVARWAAPVTVNLALGYLAVFPLSMLVVFAMNFPLAWLGLTSRDPNEDDGALPWVVLLGVMFALLLALWWLANLAVRKLSGLRVPRYWAVSAVLLVLPTALFAALPEGAWRALGWF